MIDYIQTKPLINKMWMSCNHTYENKIKLSIFIDSLILINNGFGVSVGKHFVYKSEFHE